MNMKFDGFDPKEQYPANDPFFRPMKPEEQPRQLKRISNLIIDMSYKGATPDEMDRAIKHSMVLLDAVKHRLDYKQSEKDFSIAELRAKYQKKMKNEQTD